MADGYAFRVEFRGDLTIGDWNSNGVTEEVLSENAQLQQVKVSLPVPATQSMGFARLSVLSP
ncbi:MAG: hypothetical protein H0U88_06100 [Chthoniobacterales bacterium]|nr:hypothetical protein [Chthoniobacterales bacterium]